MLHHLTTSNKSNNDNRSSNNNTIPIDVTVFGILILVIGHPANIQSEMAVVPLVTVTTVDDCSVYRFILGTEYVLS